MVSLFALLFSINTLGLLEGLSTTPRPPPHKCQKIGLAHCNVLAYNQTSYPNIADHWNLSSVEQDFISYRQIIDSECYPLAKEFICQLLQPHCVDDDIIWPCRDFCEEFQRSCEAWIPKSLAKVFDCKKYPNTSPSTSSSASSASMSTSANSGGSANKDSSIIRDAQKAVVDRNKPAAKKTCNAKPNCAAKELQMRDDHGEGGKI